jgi:16S rRNA (guanine527-N7)-methyltransferase
LTNTVSASIEQLARRYALPGQGAHALQSLLEVLAGDAAAPIAVREPSRLVHEHLADALVALELEPVRTAATLADLGSGAGIPGVPLAIARPSATVDLVESSARKCFFLEGVVAACQLANASIVHARAEAWPSGLGRFDVVTARALGPLAVVVEYAAPLLRTGGVLVAWRGRRDLEAELDAQAAARQLAMEPLDPRPVAPYADSHSRHLHVFLKLGPTPARFPRRPGVARKRPLGRSSERPAV